MCQGNDRVEGLPEDADRLSPILGEAAIVYMDAGIVDEGIWRE
jgi:hypothetical protein